MACAIDGLSSNFGDGVVPVARILVEERYGRFHAPHALDAICRAGTVPDVRPARLGASLQSLVYLTEGCDGGSL
jgi:hypothetical protein